METETVPGVDLTDDLYTIKQSLIRNKYVVTDSSGREVLRAKQKMFKVKEQFPFVNPEGEEVFRVEAQGVLDIAGDYLLNTPDGETLAILDKNFTFFKHVWKIRDPETEDVLAVVESGSLAVEVLRSIHEIASWIPHSYTIEGPNGEDFGSLEGKLSLKDTYELTLRETGDAPKEALVAAVIAVDALEGN